MAGDGVMSSYGRGAQDSLPFLLIVVPFAMLFGVLATEAGLGPLETLAFSVVVIAGAAQFTALQLLIEEAPAWIALASALAVNLRMAMYSASITPHLGGLPIWRRALAAYLLLDQTYAQSMLEYDRRPELTMPEKAAYFFGCATAVVPVWYGASLAGALVGTSFPTSLSLDFALPLAFIAITMPMLRTVAHIAAAVVAIVLALSFAFLPWNLGLLVAGLGGMMAGARVETMQERRA